MAESLQDDSVSDVPLLDGEKQASEFTMAKYLFSTRKKVFAICLDYCAIEPPAYTAGDVGTHQHMQPYPPPANPQLAGPVAPSAVVQQAGHPAAVQFVRPGQQAVQPSVVQPVQYVVSTREE